MEIALQDFKAYLKTLFLCILLMIITFNLELDFGPIIISFSLTGLVGAIILTVRTNKLKNISKEFNDIYIIGLCMIGGIILNPLAQHIISNMIFKETVQELAYQLSVLVQSGENITSAQLNSFFSFFGELTPYIVILLVVTFILTYGPLIALFIALGKLIKKHSEENNYRDAYNLEKYFRNVAICLGVIAILTIVMMATVFSMFGQITISQNNVYLDESFESTVGFMSLSSIALVVVGIVYLVFIIKTLARINTYSKDIECYRK